MTLQAATERRYHHESQNDDDDGNLGVFFRPARLARWRPGGNALPDF